MPIDLLVQLGPGATEPRYASLGAAGMDLTISRDLTLGPGERCLAPTGVRVAIPQGFEGQVRARSGLALKRGIGLVNAPGTIDCDYRGEIGVIIINWSQEIVELKAGERIAQLVICPIEKANIQLVEELPETERGEGGFGSTGQK